jgi:hypothetical protein
MPREYISIVYYFTDLILAVVRLLRKDINGLVKTVEEALEPIEL